MTDYASLLSQNVDDVKRPEPLPSGTYTAIVQDRAKVESNQKKTDGIMFTFGNLMPGDDVDQQKLQEINNLPERTIRDTFWITPDALFRLTEFLKIYGISGVSASEGIERIKGQSVKFRLKVVISDDGQRFFNNVEAYLPL